MPRKIHAKEGGNMLENIKPWKNVQTGADGLPTCSLMPQMILGALGAILLAAGVIVSLSQNLENVAMSLTKDIGCTDIHPILQVRMKL